MGELIDMSARLVTLDGLNLIDVGSARLRELIADDEREGFYDLAMEVIGIGEETAEILRGMGEHGGAARVLRHLQADPILRRAMEMRDTPG